MMAQVKTLLRVKELKCDQALREMQVKRRRLEEAQHACRQAQARVEESLATYAQREEAIYAGIMGEVIDIDDIDETHAQVVQLEKDHTRLTDALERARHVEARLQAELEAATARYFEALRILDKFSTVAEEMQREEEAAAEHREEVEVEDLTARPREKAA